MAKRVYEFRCPCCKARLELDPESGRARHIKAPESGIDELLDKHKTEDERLADQFSKAEREARNQQDKLDELFDDAFKEAKDDREKPPNPFDND